MVRLARESLLFIRLARHSVSPDARSRGRGQKKPNRRLRGLIRTPTGATSLQLSPLPVPSAVRTAASPWRQQQPPPPPCPLPASLSTPAHSSPRPAPSPPRPHPSSASPPAPARSPLPSRGSWAPTENPPSTAAAAPGMSLRWYGPRLADLRGANSSCLECDNA